MQKSPEANEPVEEGELNDEELDGMSGGTSKSGLDSLSEMGETTSLKLQMQMDRISKFQTTLSNIIQKSSQTSDAITQNLK